MEPERQTRQALGTQFDSVHHKSGQLNLEYQTRLNMREIPLRPDSEIVSTPILWNLPMLLVSKRQKRAHTSRGVAILGRASGMYLGLWDDTHLTKSARQPTPYGFKTSRRHTYHLETWLLCGHQVCLWLLCYILLGYVSSAQNTNFTRGPPARVVVCMHRRIGLKHRQRHMDVDNRPPGSLHWTIFLNQVGVSRVEVLVLW